jgi:membrane protein
MPTPRTDEVADGDAEDRSPAPRGWKRLLEISRRTLRRSADNHARDSGAAIAYYAFFSIFPLLIGMLSVAGHFFDSARAQEQVFELVDDVIPGSAVLVQENLEAVVASRGTFGLLGVLGLLWSGSAAFGAVNRAVNRAWRTQPENAILARVRYFAMTIGAAMLMTVSIGLTAVVELVPKIGARTLSRLGIDGPALERIPDVGMGLASVFMMFALIYKIAPHAKTTWRQVVPGALVGAGLFELGKMGFVFYLERFADYSVHGSVGSIIVLLLWLYFSARVLILGAELSVVLGEMRFRV